MFWKKYGTGTTVVFDSYPNYPTTKDEAHRRRTGMAAKVVIKVEEVGTVSITKKKISIK